MPLAFGEGDTKGRVMNMAKWKKPKLWVSLTCLLLCATILVACAVNPKTAGSIDGMDTTEAAGMENTAKALNIRKEPDSLSAVVGNYADGTIITILETKDGWGRTDQGWIYMDYVKTVDGTTVVDVGEFQPAVDGSVIITDTELVQYGALKMLLIQTFRISIPEDFIYHISINRAAGHISNGNPCFFLLQFNNIRGLEF